MPSSKIESTIWEKIDDRKVTLDIESIEKEFVNMKATVAEKEEDVKKKEEINKISLLPPEKIKNIEIVLGKLKLDLGI